MVSIDGSTQRAFKIPQLRNMYEKVGFEMTRTNSFAGFGFSHDGAVDSIARFVSEPVFSTASDQEVADLVALMLSFSGSGFTVDTNEPPGNVSHDAHAAVGRQVTRVDNATSGPDYTLMTQLLALADTGVVDVIAKSAIDGLPRGWLYVGSGIFQTDQATVQETLTQVLSHASTDTPVTFTVVPAGSGHRIGIDRDDDGLLDYDEDRDLAPDIPGIQNPFRPDSSDATGNSSVSPDGTTDGLNDFDGDGMSNQQELANGTNPADNLNVVVPFNLQMTTAPNVAMVTLRWDAGPLGVYQVQYSIDLGQWADSPTGRLANNGLAIAPQSWIDTGPPATPTPPNEAPLRFYRVQRLR